MRFEDITPITDYVASSQAEAVDNIKMSQKLGLTPDFYKEQKNELAPQVAQMKLPQQATEGVANAMRKSPEHAAAVAPETDLFSKIEQFVGYSVNRIKQKTGPERKRRDLIMKKMNSSMGLGEFTEDDDLTLMSLNDQATRNYGMKDYKLNGFWEKALAEVPAQVADLPAIVERNAPLINDVLTTTTIGGAMVGGGLLSPTGPGTIAGATAGAIGGFAAGVIPAYAIASAYDAYKDMTADTWDELDNARDDIGEPLNIDPTTKFYIANGVGVVASAVEYVSDVKLLKSIPFLKKATDPKQVAKLITEPANRKLKDVLLNIGKSGLINAGEEMFQEVIQILGTELGNSYANNEINFLDGLSRAATKIKSDSKTQERIASAGVTAFATGTTLTTIGEGVNRAIQPKAPKNVKPKTEIIRQNTPDEEAAGALELERGLEASRKVLEASKLNQMAPDQAAEVLAESVKAVGAETVSISKTAMQKWVGGDEKKANDLRNLIDPTGTLAQRHNAFVDLPTHKFLQFTLQYPDIIEYAQRDHDQPSANTAKAMIERAKKHNEKTAELRAKLAIGERSPEERAKLVAVTPEVDDKTLVNKLGSKEVADAYLNRLTLNEAQDTITPEQRIEIQTMRERVTKLRDTLPDDKTAKERLQKSLTLPVDDEIWTEQEFRDLPTFPQMLRGVLPDKEVDRIEAADQESRGVVIDTINEDVLIERQGVADLYEEAMEEGQREIELQKLEDDKRLGIVDKFKNIQKDKKGKKSHTKNGYSKFAIDPAFLTKEQKEKYRKDPTLKKRRVFVKGGLTPDKAAQLLGVRSGGHLLYLLASAPDREAVVQKRLEQTEAKRKKDALDIVDIDESAMAQAFHNRTRNHLQQMKYLLREEWATVKRVIKRVALPIPSYEELQAEARQTVAQIQIKDLKPNRFKVSEKRMDKQSVKAALDGNLPLAFETKLNAALNNEMALEAQASVIKVNRLLRFIKKLQTKEYQQVMKDAGPMYVNALNEVLEAYSFKGMSNRAYNELVNFRKYVSEQVALGNGDFAIPERLRDVRKPLNEMTVEEVLVIGDTIRRLYHQAKRKNELNLLYGDPAKELQTYEAAKMRVIEEVTSDQFRDAARAIPKQEDLTKETTFVTAIGDQAARLRNMHHILSQLGKDRVKNVLIDYIWAPLKGVGQYVGQGETGAANDLIAVQKHLQSLIDDFNKDKSKALANLDEAAIVERVQAYGLNEFDNLRNEYVDIPEWRNNPLLGNGKVSKAMLLAMMLNRGNEGNLTQLANNHGTDIETITAVLDRHLDERHAIFAQRIMDTFESYWERVAKLEEDVTGVRPEKVQAKPFVHRNKVYPGGYYPIMHLGDWDAIRERNVEAQKRVEAVEKFQMRADQFYASDMTAHNHTFKRTGSTKQLNLSLDVIPLGLEMVIHDLNFRKPLADAMRFVSDPDIAKAMVEVVGEANYNVIVNTLVDAGMTNSIRNNAIVAAQNSWRKIQSAGMSTISMGYLIGNHISVAIQVVSSPLVIKRMGDKGAKHMALVAKALIDGRSDLGQFGEIAAEILPSLKISKEGFDDTYRGVLSPLFPKRGEYGKAAIDKALDKVVDVGLSPLSTVDNVMKAVTAVAGYSQFMAGDVEGYSYEQVMAMPPKERDAAAKTYASSLVGMTLTTGSLIDKADVQKNAPLISQFYNDGRNVINNIMYYNRQWRRKVKQGQYAAAAAVTLSSLLTLVVMKALYDTIRGNPVPWDEDDRDPDENLVEAMAKYAVAAPISVTADAIPLVRDITFAAFRKAQIERDFGLVKEVVPTTPVQRLQTDLVNLTYAGMNFMEYWNGEREMSLQEQRSAWLVTSFALGGRLPVQLGFETYDLYENGVEMPEFIEPLSERFGKTLEKFKQKQEALPAKDKTPPEVVERLEEIKQEISPETTDETAATEIPQNFYAIIAQIESGGKWWAKNPNSSAAGLYQFTEATWEGIRQQAPELGLTSGGRVSQDTTQQDLAMEWLTKENAKQLTDARLATSAENLYAAHFLGAKKAIELLNTPASIKIKYVLSGEAMAANGFSNGMRVRDFKEWLSQKIADASQETVAN